MKSAKRATIFERASSRALPGDPQAQVSRRSPSPRFICQARTSSSSWTPRQIGSDSSTASTLMLMLRAVMKRVAVFSSPILPPKLRQFCSQLVVGTATPLQAGGLPGGGPATCRTPAIAHRDSSMRIQLSSRLVEPTRSRAAATRWESGLVAVLVDAGRPDGPRPVCVRVWRRSRTRWNNLGSSFSTSSVGVRDGARRQPQPWTRTARSTWLELPDQPQSAVRGLARDRALPV